MSLLPRPAPSACSMIVARFASFSKATGAPRRSSSRVRGPGPAQWGSTNDAAMSPSGPTTPGTPTLTPSRAGVRPGTSSRAASTSPARTSASRRCPAGGAGDVLASTVPVRSASRISMRLGPRSTPTTSPNLLANSNRRAGRPRVPLGVSPSRTQSRATRSLRPASTVGRDRPVAAARSRTVSGRPARRSSRSTARAFTARSTEVLVIGAPAAGDREGWTVEPVMPGSLMCAGPPAGETHRCGATTASKYSDVRRATSAKGARQTSALKISTSTSPS